MSYLSSDLSTQETPGDASPKMEASPRAAQVVASGTVARLTVGALPSEE